MTLEEDIAQVFTDNEWTWNIKGRGSVVPDQDDVQATLDEAARLLYDEPIGAQLEVGRLIIVKTPTSHDVYLYTGTYE